MSWSPLQREALEAMGFAVLLPRPPAGVVAAAADVAAHEAGTPHIVPERRAPDVATPTRAEPHLAPHAQDRLARALLRAAGRAPEAADAPALLAQWPDPARLRRDPAAKRALWPQLRALRRRDG